MLLCLPEDHFHLGASAVLSQQHCIELLILWLVAALIFATDAKQHCAFGRLEKRVGERVAALGIAANKGHYGDFGGLQRGLLGGLDLGFLGHWQIEPGLFGDVSEHALTNYLPEIDIANSPLTQVFGFLNFSKRRPNLF